PVDISWVVGSALHGRRRVETRLEDRVLCRERRREQRGRIGGGGRGGGVIRHGDGGHRRGQHQGHSGQPDERHRREEDPRCRFARCHPCPLHDRILPCSGSHCSGFQTLARHHLIGFIISLQLAHPQV